MRYILGVLAVILIAILVIFALSSHSSNSPATKAKEVLKLNDYADKNSSVSFMTEGPIVGEDQFTSIRITVTPTARTAEILKGYEQSVDRSEQFSNTGPAYDNFLRALGTANFVLSRTSSYPDERGVCPLGNRYIYELISEGKSVKRTWSVNCSSSVGTFAGNMPTVRRLFQNQISDYNNFSRGVGID